MAHAVPAGYESSDDEDLDNDIIFAAEVNTVTKRTFNPDTNKSELNITNDPVDWQSAIEGSDSSKLFNKSHPCDRTQDLTLHSALNRTLTIENSHSTFDGLRSFCDNGDESKSNEVSNDPVQIDQFRNYDDNNDFPDDQTKQKPVFGDLELFLLSISEADLIDLFNDHEITFKQLLTFTEQDLINVGINKVGLRKKILDGVAHLHTRKWQPSSLKDLSTKDLLTAPGIFIVLSDITKHMDYIGATLAYLKQRVENDSEVLELGKEFVSVRKLTDELDTMAKQTKSTYKQVLKLKGFIEDVSGDKNLESAHYLHLNFIKSIRSKRTINYFGKKTKIALACLTVVIVYKVANLFRRA